MEIDPAHYKAHCRRILDEMPQLYYNVFVYIISFLREVLALERLNRSVAAPHSLQYLNDLICEYANTRICEHSLDVDVNLLCTAVRCCEKLGDNLLTHALIGDWSLRCTPLLLANVATSCFMQGEGALDGGDTSSMRALIREEHSRRLQRRVFMQPVFMYFLTSQNF